jgi:hypothetical protein
MPFTNLAKKEAETIGYAGICQSVEPRKRAEYSNL